MAFGAPYFIGHVAGGSGLSQQMTVGQQTLVGDSIIVSAGNSSAAGATITGVTDSVGNVYNACVAATTTNQFGQVWAAVYGFNGPGTPTGALTTADVITATFSTTSGQKMVSAIGCSGIVSSASAVDAAASNHATSGAVSVTSAALNSTPEMAIGVIVDASTGGAPASIGGTGTWTAVGSASQSGTTPYVSVYYQSVSATTALTLSASITSANWAAFIITFEEGAAPLAEPYSLGTANSAAGADTLQLTVAASSATGDAIIVSAAVNSNASAAAPSACQDSQGNRYTLIVSTGTGNEYQTTLFVATCWSDGVSPTVALTDGVDTITVTYTTSTAATGHNLAAIGCSGLAVGPTSATVDQSAFAGNTTTGTATAATLGATAQTGELVVATVSSHNTGNAISWTSPLVNVTQPVVNGGNEQTYIGAGLNTTTVSTAYGGTINVTGKWDCAVISLFPASSGSSISLPDVAGAVDSLSVSVAASLPDVAGAADSLSLSATLPLADVVAGTDSAAVAVGASVTDVAGAADSPASAAALSLGDAGGAVDSLTPAAALSLADTGAGADASVPAAALGLADTAGAVDSLVVGAALSLLDAGASVDIMSLAAALALADAAGGVDALLLAVAVAEAAGAVDAISVSISEAGQALPWFRSALMFARWRAAVASPRWSAALMAERWRPMAGVRWPASLLPRRWGCELATRTYNVTSTEQIPARVTAPSDPTGLEVQMAFLTAPPPAQPATEQWLAATWGPDNGPPWTALCLVGPGGLMTMISGVNYYVWVQVTASPEVPVEYAGMLEAQ